MLVLILDTADPQLADIRESGGVKFGIVRQVLDSTGRYQEFRCETALDNGSVFVFPVGQLVPLLILPEEDADKFIPAQAFAKWAPEIVKRQALVHLPFAQRDFLARMRVMSGI